MLEDGISPGRVLHVLTSASIIQVPCFPVSCSALGWKPHFRVLLTGARCEEKRGLCDEQCLCTREMEAI